MAGITDLLTRALPAGGPIRGALGNGPLQGLRGGPVQSFLSNLFGGTVDGPISGQQTADDMLGRDIQNTSDSIWGQPLGGALGQLATPDQGQNQGDWGDEINSGPPAESMDPNATGMGPQASGDGGNGGGLSGGGIDHFSDLLPGGGTDSFMNGASGSMIADFSAPVNGDFMARLQSHIGQQGPNVQAKEE